MANKALKVYYDGKRRPEQAQPHPEGGKMPQKSPPKKNGNAFNANATPAVSRYEAMSNEVLARTLIEAVAGFARDPDTKLSYLTGFSPYEVIGEVAERIAGKQALNAALNTDPHLGPILAAAGKTLDSGDVHQIAWALRNVKLPSPPASPAPAVTPA